MRGIRSLLPAFVLGLSCIGVSQPAAAQAAQDCKGCKDLPLLSRYPGSFLVGQDHRDFDEITLPSEKYVTTPEFKKEFYSTVALEGKVDKLFYHSPKGRSATEVHANYQEALVKAGFAIVFSCRGDDGCGSSFSFGLNTLVPLPGGSTEASQGIPDAERPRYLLAQLKRPSGDLWAAVLTAELVQRGNAGVVIVVVETKPMETGKVVTDTAALDRGLKETGKIAVYGVYFDVDSAKVKPESKAQLEQIANLLRKDAKLKLAIAGHTDSTGDFAHNMKLSSERANAVVEALTRDFGIERSRLIPVGLGSASPVAANDTETGRAKNRRVELVKQ